MQTRTTTTNPISLCYPTDFHGASVIDALGREIPITEAMVQQALMRDSELSPLQQIKVFKQRVI